MTRVISLRKRYKTKIDIPKKSINKINIFNTEIFKIIYLAISIISILFGCIVYKNYPIEYITKTCNDFILKFQNGTYFEIFIECLKFDIFFYLIMFFVGTSIIGIPLTIVPLIIKSSLIGYFSSYMYCEYDLKGILFSLVLLYPLFVITTTSLIYSANESIYMSKYILNTITNKNTADNISIRLYVIRYAILFGINIVCIAVNSFLIITLANKFNLR